MKRLKSTRLRFLSLRSLGQARDTKCLRMTSLYRQYCAEDLLHGTASKILGLQKDQNGLLWDHYHILAVKKLKWKGECWQNYLLASIRV